MARLRVQLTGFDEMLKNIEKAGGSVNKAVDECVKKSANIIDTELRNQMIKSKADSPDHSLVKDMDKPEISWEGNTCYAKVGYKLGNYNPKNLSSGFKALFLNYGTPRRKPSQERPRKYINKAKTKANPLVKKEQEDTLNKILEDLK